MLRLFLFAFLGTCLCSASVAQENELKKEILSYKEPKAEIIGKGRKLILDKFMAGDKQKVDEVMHYLTYSVEDKDYLAFYPIERVLLYYWTESYGNVLTEIARFDSVQSAMIYQQIRPTQDLLLPRVGEKMREQRESIKKQIDATQMATSDKDFLKLNLDFLLVNRNVSDNYQDSLNYKANRFLEAHPTSIYEGFVRENIRYQYKPSKWGFGYEFFIGYGNLTGELAQQFRPSVVPWGFSFETHYKRAALFLRIGFLDTKATDSVVLHNVTWAKTTRVRFMPMEASVGLVTLDSRRIKITPFAGLTTINLEPLLDETEKHPEYEKTGLDYTTAYTMGIIADYKFTHSDRFNQYPGQGKSYWFVRLRYAYHQPQFNNKYTGFGGDLHTFTVGIGLFGRTVSREL